jgi:hypothetical protein
MDLLLQLQQDLTDKLNSEETFQYNAAASLRGQVIRQEIERRLPHLTAKNGRKGCGILVRMPAIRGLQPNVASPQGEVLVAIDVVEAPEINFNPGGTQLTAEEVARGVRSVLHQFAIEGKILLYQDEKAIEPVAGLEKEYPGCLGYRVLLRGRMSEPPAAKCALPAISAPAQTVTLTSPDSGAAIYYTTDGSFPGAGNAGGTAALYTGPFTVGGGTVVRWAGYLAGRQGSDAGQATIV